MVISSHWQMKEEEGRRIATMDAFNVVDKRIHKLAIKPNEANKDKKGTEVTL